MKKTKTKDLHMAIYQLIKKSYKISPYKNLLSNEDWISHFYVEVLKNAYKYNRELGSLTTWVYWQNRRVKKELTRRFNKTKRLQIYVWKEEKYLNPHALEYEEALVDIVDGYHQE